MSLLGDIEQGLRFQLEAFVPEAEIVALGAPGKAQVESVPVIEIVWSGPTDVSETLSINGITFQTLEIPVAVVLMARDDGGTVGGARFKVYDWMDSIRTALTGFQPSLSGACAVFPLVFEGEEMGWLDTGLYGVLSRWRLAVKIQGERRGCP